MNDTLIERLDWVATVAEDTEGLGNKAYLICDKAVDTITIQAERIAELEAELQALRDAANTMDKNSWYHHGTKCVNDGDFLTLKDLLEKSG